MFVVLLCLKNLSHTFSFGKNTTTRHHLT